MEKLRLAHACEHGRAMRDGDAGAGQPAPVSATCVGHFRVAANVDAVGQDRTRIQQSQLLEPAQRRGLAQLLHQFEFVARRYAWRPTVSAAPLRKAGVRY